MPSTSGALALRVENVDDLQRLARLFAASGLFGQPRGNPDSFVAECAIKLLVVMEAGFTPSSVAGVTVINGKPGFSANLLAQAIKRHPVYDYRVLEKSATICRIRFLANGEELGVETFSLEMAERAGLLKTSGPWRQYPEAMLFARCLTAGMRTHCPDALGGAAAYTAEELGGTTELVTVSEVPSSPAPGPVMLTSTDDLVAGALRAVEARGLTAEGLVAFCQEIGGVSTLAELPKNMLARLAKNGLTPETVERCNAQAEALMTEVEDDPDDLPAAWN